MSCRALIADDEDLCRQVVRSYLGAAADVELVAETATGADTARQLLELRPELVFLDVQMPEGDGFEVLRAVWPHHQPVVIFTTAYDQYALRAFEAHALDYLLKPFTPTRFQQALARAREQLRLAAAARPPGLGELVAEPPAAPLRRLLIKEGRRFFFVKLAEVMYVEADGNYLVLHTHDGRRHLLYESLSRLEKQLDPATFVRISRGCVLNLDYVASLETYFNGEYIVTLQPPGTTLKWTRLYRDNATAFFARQG